MRVRTTEIYTMYICICMSAQEEWTNMNQRFWQIRMKFTHFVSLYVNIQCTEELQDTADVEDISKKAI